MALIYLSTLCARQKNIPPLDRNLSSCIVFMPIEIPSDYLVPLLSTKKHLNNALYFTRWSKMNNMGHYTTLLTI